MSETMPFVIRWPEDASRMAPVPGGHQARFIASKQFTVVIADHAVAAKRCGTDFVAEALLPDVSDVTEQVIDWRFNDGGNGSSWIVLLPDAETMRTDHVVTGPWNGKHGVLANRRGAAVQARASWGRLDSKYDALLAANLSNAGPGDRRVVLPAVRMTLVLGHDRHEITGDAVARFEADAQSLHWLFSLHDIRFAATLRLGEGNAIRLDWQMLAPVAEDVQFIIRPLIDDRSFHGITKAYQGAEQRFPASVSAESKGFSFRLHDEHVLHLQGTTPFRPEPHWTYCMTLPLEAARGLEDMMDVFSPGEFIWRPATQRSFTITACIDGDAPPSTIGNTHPPDDSMPFAQAMQQSLELYLADRGGEITVIAGFPWFLDWGRDSLIFTRGLIAMGRHAEAGSILRRFGSFEHKGTLPNLLRGAEVTNRETSDAPLWWIVAAGEWITSGGAADTACGDRTMLEIMRSIAQHYLTGTNKGVRVNPKTGLVFSPPHFTWMDTDNPCGTPRAGFPIEIQALWIAALRTLQRFDAGDWITHAHRAQQSLEQLFWNDSLGFFSDCLHASTVDAAPVADDHLRPNQWLAITLGAVTDEAKMRRALESSQCLLLPGAARSLAPRRVNYGLNIRFDVDPHHPYWPRYTGPEDQTRKPAYHNGTGWCWQYPLFAEAMIRTFGSSHLATARKLMSASVLPWRDGCVSQLPEITDGDMPHLQRGCGAQAWSVSEWVRVWQIVENGIVPANTGA